MTEKFTDKKLVEIKRLVFAVTEESKRQLTKWGIQTHTLDRWNTIISEEYGELSTAILEYDLRAIYDEAIQVATLSLKIAEMALHELLKDENKKPLKKPKTITYVRNEI